MFCPWQSHFARVPQWGCYSRVMDDWPWYWARRWKADVLSFKHWRYVPFSLTQCERGISLSSIFWWSCGIYLFVREVFYLSNSAEIGIAWIWSDLIWCGGLLDFAWKAGAICATRACMFLLLFPVNEFCRIAWTQWTRNGRKKAKKKKQRRKKKKKMRKREEKKPCDFLHALSFLCGCIAAAYDLDMANWWQNVPLAN